MSKQDELVREAILIFTKRGTGTTPDGLLTLVEIAELVRRAWDAGYDQCNEDNR